MLVKSTKIPSHKIHFAFTHGSKLTIREAFGFYSLRKLSYGNNKRKRSNMVTDAQLKNFRGQGYFIIEDMFTAHEIDDLTAHIEPFVHAHEANLAKAGNDGISRAKEISFTTHLAEKDSAIKAFVSQPKLVNIATTILGPNVRLYWDQAVYKRPETRRDFPWHQDTGYTPVIPEEYLTCWVALENANIENGCIWIMPGTQTQGLVEHKETPVGKQCYFGSDPGIAVELRKGSVAFFSSLTFHRSGPNLSGTIRKGYIIQYAEADVRDKVSGEPRGQFLVAEAGLC